MASVKRHQRGKDKPWQVRWRDPSGAQLSTSFRLKGDADAFARDVETAKQRGTYDRFMGTQATTVADYTSTWEALRRDRARSTRDRDHSYLTNHVLPAFGSKAVGSVTASQVKQWVSVDLAHLAPSTRAKCLQLLRSVLQEAVDDGLIVTNPAASVKAGKVSKVRSSLVLSDEQVAALVDAAEVIDTSQAPVVWVMARCGLRVGEALALKRSDIDLAAGTLTVQRNLSRREGIRAPKTAAGVRTVPMPDDLAERLADHLAETPAHVGGWLCFGAHGARLDYTRWRARRWVLITRLAGLDGVVPHDLRHTVTTRLVVRDGFGPAQLKEYLGHADATTALNIYAHLTVDDLPRPSSVPMLRVAQDGD